MKIKTIGVIGAGQMGSGIAQVAAASGHNVIMNDIKEDFVQRGMNGITKFLSKSVDKGKMSSDDKDAILSRLKTSVEIDDMKDADLVIEAAVENMELKTNLFQKLDSLCREDVILATNTSSIPIGSLAATTKRPDKVIGMHFFNPVPLMELVEVIRAITTSDETYKTIWDLSIKMGKSPAGASDYAGFAANRILMPMINEAIFCLYTGVGNREDIDKVMKLGMNHPMGPLELADLIGLDTCLSVLETIYNGFNDSKYRPCPLLKKYVEAGWLGRKTGRGFYEYK